MIQTDYGHLENLIVQAMVNICRDDNKDREIEMTKMIQFMGKMHVTAIMTFVGAVLISATMTDDQDKIDAMMKAVRDLVQAQDAEFSMQIRSKVLAFVAEHGTPDPFTHQSTQSDSQ